MSAKQIMKSKVIVSCVPYKVKAQAVYDTLNNDVTNMIPATILKTHDNYTLFLDENQHPCWIRQPIINAFLAYNLPCSVRKQAGQNLLIIPV